MKPQFFETPMTIVAFLELCLALLPGMGILAAGIGNWVFTRAVQKGLGTRLPFGEDEK